MTTARPGKPGKNSPRTPPSAARLAAFFDALDGMGMDGAVLDRRDDIFYLSGYTGSDAVAVLDARKRRGWLLTDSRYVEEGEATARGLQTVTWKNGFADFTGRWLKKLGFAKTAYTPASLTVGFFAAMRKTAGRMGWRDAGTAIAGLRAIKGPDEVKAMEKALACAEGAFLAARSRWRVGMTETDVKNDLEWEMRRRGAEDAAFETIVAAGPNASLPHAHAGRGRIQAGKMLLIDFGARVGRYNSDLTRTLWAGHVPAVWLKRYRAVLEAQAAGLAAIRAGGARSEPDIQARAALARAGLEKHFTHSLGHGVGLAVHEEPRLSRAAAGTLAAGHVVTVEPGVYFPGVGGIRVEDMVLVRDGGGRVLSSLAKDENSLLL